MAGPPTISTHVLDLGTGEPAAGVPVALFRLEPEGRPELLVEMETDDDGRITSFLNAPLEAGSYQLVFDVAEYLQEDAEFFENVAIGFRVDDAERGYHVPLLLSAFSLATYRGS